MDMSDLLSCASKISDSLGDHVKNTGKIEEKIEQKFSKEAVKDIPLPVLKEDLKKTQKQADKMKEKVKKAETEVSGRMSRLEQTLEQSTQEFITQMTKMQKQLDDTQSTVRDLQNMKQNLHTGQTAYDFESYLCTYIYPKGMSATHDQKLTTLMKWLKENEDTPEGREGNRKWKQLTDKHGWKDKTHIPVFFKMLESRLPHAHPTIDYSLPIPENFHTSEEKKYVNDIRKITIELYELVKRNAWSF